VISYWQNANKVVRFRPFFSKALWWAAWRWATGIE